MTNKKHTIKQLQGKKAEIHPGSRRAGQMDRIILRKSKLSKANQLRNRSRKGKLERPHFWFDSLPEPPFAAHSLESLHRLVHDLFLRRWDDYLAELKKERRAGRPKCKEQVEVEEIKRQEEAEYDTGFDLPDLTHEPTVALLRTWNTKDASFLPLLRMIRISRTEPDVVVLVRAGLAKGFQDGDEPAAAAAAGDAAEDGGMDVDGVAPKESAVKGLEKGMIGRIWRGPHVDKP